MSEGRELIKRYDVGAEVRRITDAFMSSEDGLNRFTPANLRVLLNQLDRLTGILHQEDVARRRRLTPAGVIMDTCDQLCTDLARWSVRLREYNAAVNAIPFTEEQQNDRNLVLWTVTAPLFFGWYGGPDGKDPVSIGSQPQDFDVNVQHAPDLATPFSLSNQLGVHEDFKVSFMDEVLKTLDDYITHTKIVFHKTKEAVGDLFLMAGVGVAGIAILALALRRK